MYTSRHSLHTIDINWTRTCLLTARLHRTGIAEVMGSNPVGASESFLGFICNCFTKTDRNVCIKTTFQTSTSISITQHNYLNDLHVTCRYPAFELELHHDELLYRRPLCAVLVEDWAVICESLIEPSSIPREVRQPGIWKTLIIVITTFFSELRW